MRSGLDGGNRHVGRPTDMLGVERNGLVVGPTLAFGNKQRHRWEDSVHVLMSACSSWLGGRLGMKHAVCEKPCELWK